MMKPCANPQLTCNQDYGSFYCVGNQRSPIEQNEIALELAINDHVRRERRQFPSIAYDLIFDVGSI